MTPIQDQKSNIRSTTNRSCRFVTLGCKVNQYDTQLVREAMLDSGYHEAAAGEPADVCVINTCTVTENADADGRYEIRRLIRQNPNTKIVVMGCYAARDPERIRNLPGVALVVEHPDRLRERFAELGVERIANGISRFAGHHRAFVKVQDGCILNCAFCIIPKVRPRLSSRPPNEIEAEVRRLVAAGFHEVVLTGIHLGHYGLEWSRGKPRSEWCRLSTLVRRLVNIPGAWRLRLSSLEATEVSDELVDTIAHEPRVCPHLHLCLQSGSDQVLSAMKRRYRVAGFLRRVHEIRQRLDQPALTSDVIVGFPNETERDFDETLQVCETANFSKIHIFPFSSRKGTIAASLTPQLDGSLIRDRKCRLQALESKLAERYHQSLVGRELEVLVERVPKGMECTARGTACRYVPVEFVGGDQDEYQLVRLHVTDARSGHVIGRRIAHRSSNEWPSLTVLNEATERTKAQRGPIMPETSQQRITVLERDGAIVVQFRDSKILEDRTIQQLGTELIDLIQGRSAPQMVLDFTGVKYLSSAALGKLITLRRKVDQLGGRLKLCEIDSETMDVFKIAKLDDYFEIHPDQQAALNSLKQ